MNEYLLVICMGRGPDITLTCESEHDLKRRASDLSEIWKAVHKDDPMSVMQIQGDHGMHSTPAYLVMRIDPVVRERKGEQPRYGWGNTPDPDTIGSSILNSPEYRRMIDHDRDRED